jgi:Mg2+-importing ATPase
VLKLDKQDVYTLAAEHSMTLVGFAAFLDPPKEGILSVIEALNQNGVAVVIMTGDNQYVTQKIASDIGLGSDRMVTGDQVDEMDNAARCRFSGYMTTHYQDNVPPSFSG